MPLVTDLARILIVLSFQRALFHFSVTLFSQVALILAPFRCQCGTVLLALILAWFRFTVAPFFSTGRAFGQSPPSEGQHHGNLRLG